MKRAVRSLIAAAGVALVFAAPAAAMVYRGAGTDDAHMPVKLVVSGRDADFTYSDVLVNCTDGSQVRQGGAVHAARINAEGRFRDTLEVEGDEDSTIDWTTSVVRGKVAQRKAWGTVSYLLEYDAGECRADDVHWVARRR